VAKIGTLLGALFPQAVALRIKCMISYLFVVARTQFARSTLANWFCFHCCGFSFDSGLWLRIPCLRQFKMIFMALLSDESDSYANKNGDSRARRWPEGYSL